MSRSRSSIHVRLGATLVALALLLTVAASAAHSHGNDAKQQPCAVCVLAGTPMTVAAPVAVHFDSVEVGGLSASSWLPASSCHPASRPSRAPPAS